MNLYTLMSRIQAAALHATYTSAWDRGRVYNHSTMFIKCVCKIYICIYIYIYRYVCIYVYIYIYTSVWPLGEYEAAFLVLRRKDRNEGHTKASPCIPLVVENYISCRVADPWIGFWVSAYPRDTFTSLASSPSHSSSFYYSLSLLLTSSHVDFSIPSYLCLFFRS